jgi:hypothetical protein
MGTTVVARAARVRDRDKVSAPLRFSILAHMLDHMNPPPALTSVPLRHLPDGTDDTPPVSPEADRRHLPWSQLPGRAATNRTEHAASYHRPCS